jgi:quercetin dioxygenase-like cupin family protein
VLTKAGDSFGGHKHHFDHVSLLTSGTVEVEVDGHPPKQFTAPTFIIIKKEHEHKFTALTDDVVWYCVFALRDYNGEVTDVYGDQHNPLSAAPLVE